MKIAIVHDDLIQFGGAEKVLMAIYEIWPKAPIYTSVASEEWQEVCREKQIELKTSFMQKLPLVKKLNRYYSVFLMHALAFESFDFSGYDVVISTSTRYAHSVITKPETTHICYMHSPGRMIWESSDYFKHENFGFFKPFKNFSKLFLSKPLSHLRKWDFVSAQRPDFFIANATLSKNRIDKYYKREATVIYPFVDFDLFSDANTYVGEYFLVVTRLASWKKVEIAIKACNKLGLPLKIAGSGPDEDRLKEMAGSTVEFLGYVQDDEKVKLYAKSKALILTQKEDFGITPLEAMAAGKPIIAYGKGGALETVIEGKTGEFFDEQNPESLMEVLQNFNESNYGPYHCKAQAREFTKTKFQRKIKTFVQKVLKSEIRS